MHRYPHLLEQLKCCLRQHSSALYYVLVFLRYRAIVLYIEAISWFFIKWMSLYAPNVAVFALSPIVIHCLLFLKMIENYFY